MYQNLLEPLREMQWRTFLKQSDLLSIVKYFLINKYFDHVKKKKKKTAAP